MVQPSDIARMAEQNVFASMQPVHFAGDEATETAIGTDRISRSHPWGSLKEAGVEQAFGTDFSIIPFNPIYGLFVAATRINYHLEFDWRPEEAIGVSDAILYYTIGSAKSMKMDDIIGSIEVGKKADLVMFSIDLHDIIETDFILEHMDLEGLDDFVLMTMSDGRIVYEPE